MPTWTGCGSGSSATAPSSPPCWSPGIVVFLVGGAGGRRHRVRRARPGLPLPAGLRPEQRPNDPVARYRTVVLTRLRLIGIGVPALIGISPASPRRATGSGSAVPPRRRLRDRATRSSAKTSVSTRSTCRSTGWCWVICSWPTFLAFVANLVGHYIFGGIRLSGRTGALSRSARIQLVSLVGTAGAAQSRRVLDGPLRAAIAHVAAASRSPAPATPTSTPCCRPS